MKHVVFLSGGRSSWAAAKRVADEHGTDDMRLLFTDVLGEDASTYRFLIEGAADVMGVEASGLAERAMEVPPFTSDANLERRKEVLPELAADAMERIPRLVWTVEGRTVWDVFFDVSYLGNSRADPCSRVLKRETAHQWVEENCDPDDTTLYVGIDWTEAHRMEGVWTAWEPYDCQAPLLDPPRFAGWQINEMIRERGMEPPDLYALGHPHSNCFTPTTEFWTPRGQKQLGDFVGQSVRVLGSNGGWKDAEVRAFGCQEIVELLVSRHGQEKVIETTANHRWFVRTNPHSRTPRERLTADLQAGDRLYSMWPSPSGHVRLSPVGVRRGIVYGDGSRQTAWNHPSYVVLCGDKDRQLLEWFPTFHRKETEVGVRVSDMPKEWADTPPDMGSSKSILWGWLAGYFAADGSVSKRGECVLSSANPESVHAVRDIAMKLGIPTTTSSYDRTGYGDEPTTLYRVSLLPGRLREDFFLIEKHRQRYTSRPTANSKARPADWKVEGVKATERTEDVVCAVVPDGESFTLAGGIFTGNCSGACVKQGHGGWALLLEKRPGVYAYWERKEQQIREELGDVAILRDRKREGVLSSLGVDESDVFVEKRKEGGDVVEVERVERPSGEVVDLPNLVPLTLRDFRERLASEEMNQEEMFAEMRGCGGCFVDYEGEPA